jgi:hypothetical protein
MKRSSLQQWVSKFAPKKFYEIDPLLFKPYKSVSRGLFSSIFLDIQKSKIKYCTINTVSLSTCVCSSDNLVIKIIIRAVQLNLRAPPLLDVIDGRTGEVLGEGVRRDGVLVAAAAQLLGQLERWPGVKCYKTFFSLVTDAARNKLERFSFTVNACLFNE